MKTGSCNFDHLIPNFYIVKLFIFSDKAIHPFPLFLLKNRLWVYPQFLSQEKQQQNEHNFRR